MKPLTAGRYSYFPFLFLFLYSHVFHVRDTSCLKFLLLNLQHSFGSYRPFQIINLSYNLDENY